ncbi:predicted protein [Pyrenophora tritici-repentis Pt-1C-BFP]|uniref:Uncharacterized protein n=1 Tax=Pyrenophora tritici-repentis (strain Pt-1C-BFP) TaxID=426418 RepID=B2WN52_PYRTR|nr:uncharacterized protein PTRG_11501 [Pyrenophora tritici-repentis Pt-1C-BFP]EDU44551.1 predicted protein [Pyrenophora tritici-repentis Pt-1C-BFP]
MCACVSLVRLSLCPLRSGFLSIYAYSSTISKSDGGFPHGGIPGGRTRQMTTQQLALLFNITDEDEDAIYLGMTSAEVRERLSSPTFRNYRSGLYNQVPEDFVMSWLRAQTQLHQINNVGSTISRKQSSENQISYVIMGEAFGGLCDLDGITERPVRGLELEAK